VYNLLVMDKSRNAGVTEVEAAELLRDVAMTLNKLTIKGINVRLKHDTVITECGYVLRVNEGYVARTLTFTEFGLPSSHEDDENW
jgi:hypothetical protein